VFLRQHPRAEGVGRVVVAHRHRRLRDDRPGVHFRRDEMHRAAVDFHAIGQRALMRVQALVGGQQGRVDVEHPARPALDEPRRQQAHEAGETDDLDAARLQRRLHRALEFLAGFELPMVDGERLDALRRGRREARRVRAVRQHERDLGGIIGRLGRGEQARHVRAATRDQRGDLLAGGRAAHRSRRPR
jgi:hypothetical protein